MLALTILIRYRISFLTFESLMKLLGTYLSIGFCFLFLDFTVCSVGFWHFYGAISWHNNLQTDCFHHFAYF